MLQNKQAEHHSSIRDLSTGVVHAMASGHCSVLNWTFLHLVKQSV